MCHAEKSPSKREGFHPPLLQSLSLTVDRLGVFRRLFIAFAPTGVQTRTISYLYLIRFEFHFFFALISDFGLIYSTLFLRFKLFSSTAQFYSNEC